MASDCATPCRQERPVALCLQGSRVFGWGSEPRSPRAPVLAAAAHYVMDKLLCVFGCIGVVLLISAQSVVFREYFLWPVQKSWFRFCHMGTRTCKICSCAKTRRSRSVFSMPITVPPSGESARSQGPYGRRSHISQTHDGPSSFRLEFMAASDERFMVNVTFTHGPGAAIALSRHSSKIRCPHLNSFPIQANLIEPNRCLL
jgi:hypothetical protein